ncbi:hypothetical protein GC207_15190 [bacterium]|nr:hypothetical protein [bacterium]
MHLNRAANESRFTSFGLLFATAFGYAFGMNDNADVVGESQVSGTGYYFAFYKPNGGTMVNLGTLSGTVASEALDINNNGLIVGDSTYSSGFYPYHAWVGVAGLSGLADLNSVTDHGSLTSYQAISLARAANDRDAIAGSVLVSISPLEIRGVQLRPNE